EKRVGGGRAVAVADGVLAATKSLLLLAVIVGRQWIAARRRSREPGVVERVLGLGEFGAQRAGIAAPGILAVLPGLATPEIRQHVRVGPAARALLRPAIVVAGITARVGHDVDRRRPAQNLAAHGLDAPPVEIRLGIGLIAPVEHA